MPAHVREYEPLAPHTTLKVGGVARYFAEVTSVEELQTAVRFAKQNALPFFVLDGGSNVLVSDNGWPGLVVKIALRGVTYTERTDGSVLVTVGAGEVFDVVVADTVIRGYWGLENLSHIPGTAGATPVQNVGAYGVEVAQCISSITTYHVPSDTEHVFRAADCAFGYRDSFFKTAAGKEYIVTSLTFCLAVDGVPACEYTDLARYFAHRPLPTLREVRAAVIAIRANKFPDWTRVGTAGSFFKNPILTRAMATKLQEQFPGLPLYDVDADTVKCSLGYILDKVCGLRGYCEGGVCLSAAQALVLTAASGSTEQDIRTFVMHVTEVVLRATGITIEWEVTASCG